MLERLSAVVEHLDRVMLVVMARLELRGQVVAEEQQGLGRMVLQQLAGTGAQEQPTQ
jgi:hypothetical protein